MLQYNPTITGSLQVLGDITGTVNGINITGLSQSVSTQLISVQVSTGSSDAKFETLSGVTSSALTRLTNIESKSASVDISISNINSITASNIARLSNLETKSSSVDISISSINTFTSSNDTKFTTLGTYTGSLDTKNTTLADVTSSLISKTGSYATTGSNQFYGTQVFSGSVFIANDLIVQGSSSIQYISASSVSIGTNIVQLNTANPSVRFAGLTIIDSGSIGGSGSFLYDSVHDEFVFVHRGNGTNVTSSHFVLGPETYDSLGNETYLTCNVITKGTGKEHLVDSCIFDNGTTVCVNATLKASGQVCSMMGTFSCVGIGILNPIAPLTIKSSGATGIFLACDTTNAAASSRLFFESCHNQFSVLNSSGKLQFNYAASSPSTSGTLGMVMDSSGSLLVGTGTAVGTEKLGVTKDDGVGNGLHVIADFNRSLGSSAELVLGYIANGSTVTGPVVYSSNNFPLLFSAGATERMRITSGGCVGIGATSPCSLLNVHCVSAGGDALYTNMFTITTDVSNIYNHLAFSLSSMEFRRQTETAVDLCIRTLVCNGSSGGNIVFAPNLDATSLCSYPRMKIQQNGFIGIGAFCAQTYLHVCDNLSAGRDDLIRLQTTISTNHAWMKSISCAGVTSIFGSNRANTDGTLIANHAVAGTTSGHNFDLISNGIVRIRLSSSGAVCLLGNSSDYPSLFLAGPNYTMVSMGDRSSSSATDVGFISVFNQGCRVIDLPGNSDAITFNTGGPMIAGRTYANGDPTYGYQFLEICNANMFHGPLTMGNSAGGLALTPLYCGGGKRWNIGWNSGELNNMTNYNNCTPFVLAWGINGDNAAADRKFCFNYSGNAYSTGGTWGTLSSNCIIKDCITAANSQWNDIKNICIVNYKMRDEITEFGNVARMHLGVIAEQIAEVSPGLLEDGGYNEKWCVCLNGVKTSILHMKAVKALQEAMYRIEVLESCLGLS